MSAIAPSLLAEIIAQRKPLMSTMVITDIFHWKLTPLLLL